MKKPRIIYIYFRKGDGEPLAIAEDSQEDTYMEELEKVAYIRFTPKMRKILKVRK